MSTDSGIPGYRDDRGEWQRSPPITAQEFLRSPAARQRYWARSMIGWPPVARARPNPAHHALARLEAGGRLVELVTQNVDGLHQAAGSERVIELHGGLARVVCLDCGTVVERTAVQSRLEADNAGFASGARAPAPDGDADAAFADLPAFVVPACALCGGVLKPDVVFFGENVPRARVDAAFAALDAADAMLVVGSSLMVWSGYRFCERAAASAKPIAAVNRGRTRADHLFALKVERSCTEVLAEIGAVQPDSG